MKSNVLSIHAISIRHIKSIEDIIAITRFFHSVIGLNFHPDTPFSDYIDRDKKPTFDAYNCNHGDAIIQKMFEVAEANNRDLYEICMEADPIIPKILVTVKGGIVQDISSNTDFLECYVADFDTDDIIDPFLLIPQQINYVPGGNFHKNAAPEIQEALKEVGF